ncbi:hypothetical protein Tco_0593823 [Tanacetum coccineum]
MAAESMVPQLVDKKGGSYYAIAPRIEPGKFNKWKKRMHCYLTGMKPYYIKCIKEGPYQPITAEGEIKPGLSGKWLSFSQGLRNANHTQTLDLADIYGSSFTSQSPKTFQSKNKGIVAETFDWDEEEVLDNEEMTQVKVLMALADDELLVGKNHARNGEWIDITMRKCRDDLLALKQAKLDVVTFQIQNTKLTKLNHALQEQLKEERKGDSPSSEVMTLTYQDHSLRERPGLGIMIHTKPKIQESSSKNVLGPIIVSDTKPITPLVPTEVKNTEQESKINEMTKLVLMLIDEKVDPSQKTQESKYDIPQSESSKSGDSLKDHLGKFDATSDDEYFLGYSFVSIAFRVFNTRRQQIKETYHVALDESMEATRFTNTLVDEIRIDDSSRYPLGEYLNKDDPSRQYQAKFIFSYYIIPHGRLLTELLKDTHVPKVIAPNEQDTPHTKDVKGPPDLINTKQINS